MSNPEPRSHLQSSATIAFSDKELLLLKLELLKKIDLFKSLPDPTLKALAEESATVLLEKNDILFNEGDQEDNIKIYILLSGQLLIYKGADFKKRIVVLNPGEYTGEMALIDTQPRAASAMALGDTLLMEIGHDLFNEHIASDCKALLEMVKVLSHRIRNSLDQMLSEMQELRILAHDMKNCLNPLGIAEINLMKMKKFLNGTDESHHKRKGTEEVEKGFKAIRSTRNSLVTLIDQSMHCVKNRKTDYIRSHFQILPLIEETIEEVSCHSYLEGKNIIIKYSNDRLKNGLFNSLDIKRVLQNLLINAGYVIEKNGTIEVMIKDQDDFNLVSIKDYGCGIPEDIKGVLLKNNYTNKPDGNGFGLMSCREIIEDFHEGRIWFESEEGKGTTFHFTIPHCVCKQCKESVMLQ